MSPPPPAPAPAAGLRARLRGGFSQTRRTLALVWRSSPRGTLALAALTLLAATLPPAMAWIGKLIVDAVVAAREAAPGPARDAAARHALTLVGVELAAVALVALVERGLSLCRTLVGSRLGVDVNVAILDKALTLDLAQFEDPTFYDKLTRARREASSRPLQLVQEHFQLGRNALALGGYVALLIGFSGWMVLGILVATIPAFVAEARFSQLAFRLRNWRSPDTRRLHYLERVLTSDEHAKEVKLFALGPLLRDRYRRLAESFFADDRRLAVGRATWGYLLSLLSTLTFYGCYALIAAATVRGRLSLGGMTLYLVAFRQGQQAFQSLLSAVGGMYEHSLYMSNLFDYLETPSSRGGAAAVPPALVARAEAGLRFENVGFRYPDAPGWALRGIDLHVGKGESLAIVGENGAGKTTLIKLLVGLYRPTEGRVLLDGRDLADWDPIALRRRVGVIFQDFAQYQLLLRENVGVGSVEHIDDRPRLERAVASGGAAELVATLSAGLDTQLGRWFADGVELSGGQWQKIALARAFMREEADILILDEPTAALDAEAEHAVFQRFRQLAAGRTTILISHRFPTVRMANRIIVLERGRILEQGSHDALLAGGGRYARLFSLQAEGYR